MAKKQTTTIRPELLGAEITTKLYPSKIKISNTQSCIDLCRQLKLDVFTTETAPDEK